MKTRVLFEDMNKQITVENNTRKTADVEMWTKMSKDISIAYDKLVKTNIVVIKTNGILKKN